MTKSSAKNMLIFALVGVVSFVFVLSFGYASIAFNIAKHGYVEGIASAEVSSIVTNTEYAMVDIENSYLGNVGTNHVSGTSSWVAILNNLDLETTYTFNWYKANMFIASTQVNFSLIWYVNDPETTGWSTCSYVGYFAGNYKQTGMSSDGWYTGTYRRSDAVYTTATSIVDSVYDYTLTFSSLPANLDNTAWAIYNLHYIIDEYVSSDAPILNENSAILFDYTLPIVVDGAFSDSVSLQFNAYEITNAASHFHVDMNSGVVGVSVDIKYFFTSYEYSESSFLLSIVNDDVDNNTASDMRYYLCICVPSDCYAVEIKFSDGIDSLRIGNDFVDILESYKDNFEIVSDFITSSNVYLQGYNAGLEVGAEGAEDNNLLSVIWAVFELPFKLLFGYYDSDVNSPTYQQYVGGLFNFYILGIDLRPFVLSIMSVCIIIGIFRIILGARGLR